MNLDDLEFKAEDFLFEHIEKCDDVIHQLAKTVTERANRILQEKLKANRMRIFKVSHHLSGSKSDYSLVAQIELPKEWDVEFEQLDKPHARSDSSRMCLTCGMESNACDCEDEG